MKIVSTPSIIVLAAVVLSLSTCKKESGPQGPAGPALTGNLYGFVDLYDQYGSKILTGISGTSATLNGTTVTTDSTGKYTFPNVSTGEYSLSYSRPGFGPINANAVQFVGGGNLDHDVKLSVVPNFTDSVLTVSDTLENLALSGTLTGTDTRRRTVAIFIGATSSTSSNPANYLLTYNTLTNNNVNTINSFSIKIPVQDLSNAGFVSGSTVYIAVYGASANFASSSTYEDLNNTGRSYFTAVSETAATSSIILP